MEILKPWLHSPNTPHFHTRLTELHSLSLCFTLLFIWQSKQSVECCWRQKFIVLPSRNHYKCKHLCLHVLWYCCLCILFTFLIVVLLVYFCLLVYHFLILVFVVILSLTLMCKQVCLQYCFVFVAFVYNFNVKQWEIKTLESKLFSFS